jgi:hypothetical protein
MSHISLLTGINYHIHAVLIGGRGIISHNYAMYPVVLNLVGSLLRWAWVSVAAPTLLGVADSLEPRRGHWVATLAKVRMGSGYRVLRQHSVPAVAVVVGTLEPKWWLKGG